MPLFGGGARDRAQLVRTLETLGQTSVAQLSQALAWPPTRTTKALRSLARSGAFITFDAATGAVGPFAGPPAPASPPPTAASPASGPAVPPAPSIPDAGALPIGGPCTLCHQPLTATGTPGTFYCAHCGNLETFGTPRPTPASAAPTTGPGVQREGGVDDRRAQELFAAWVTGSPIACPRCHRPLDHRGVESYTCPACGERVSFTPVGRVSVAPAPSA
jgi:predicted RNA-binding Zn-ribbon protein involved in translation (DUF1610 family)